MIHSSEGGPRPQEKSLREALVEAGEHGKKVRLAGEVLVNLAMGANIQGWAELAQEARKKDDTSQLGHLIEARLGEIELQLQDTQESAREMDHATKSREDMYLLAAVAELGIEPVIRKFSQEYTLRMIDTALDALGNPENSILEHKRAQLKKIKASILKLA